MATQKQIEANRRNAQKSTGPRSEAGKSVTRLNAKRDGFTGQVITLSEEDRPVFEKFKAQFIADLALRTTMDCPVGGLRPIFPRKLQLTLK